MKKKNGNLSELMRFAGRHKYLTYSSWVLSVVSAALALVPFVYIFFIIKRSDRSRARFFAGDEYRDQRLDGGRICARVYSGVCGSVDVFASVGVPNCGQCA